MAKGYWIARVDVQLSARLFEQVLRELPDLSPAQREEIEAAQAEMRERAANASRNPEGRQQQLQSARQRMISRVNAALTPEQRALLRRQWRGSVSGRSTPREVTSRVYGCSPIASASSPPGRATWRPPGPTRPASSCRKARTARRM